MNFHFHAYYKVILMLLIVCLFLSSCGSTADAGIPVSENSVSSTTLPAGSSGSTAVVSSSTKKEDSAKSSDSGTRDHTSTVCLPSADGTKTYGNDSVTIDASNTSEGYIMVNYTGSSSKVKFQITGTDDVTYTYNLHGDYETFPLTSGSGKYQLGVYENIQGTSYSTLFSQTINISITNEFGPFLYANQYVNFTDSTRTIKKASSLAASADTDIDVVQNVYNFIISNFTYDYDKASNVESGYLPEVDTIFSSKTGICFDYAAVMATMLRTQNIPTRLEVGYVGDVYHAWISTYISGKGWINGIIEFDGNEWKLMDPTFASTSSSPKDFISDTDDYLTKYVY